MEEMLKVRFITTEHSRLFTEETKASLEKFFIEVGFGNPVQTVSEMGEAINAVYHEEYEDWNGEDATNFIKKFFKGDYTDEQIFTLVNTVFEEIQQHWGLHLFKAPVIQ